MTLPLVSFSLRELTDYFTGEKAIDQICHKAHNLRSGTGESLPKEWEIKKGGVGAKLREIYALFLKSMSLLFFCVGISSLSKRCYVASCQAMAPSFFLQYSSHMGDKFLMPSLNAHHPHTADLYLRSPGIFPIEELDAIGEQRQEIQFFHRKGICRGMANWFLYLYFRTKSSFTDPDAHIRAVTEQFVQGAPREASLLHSLNEEVACTLLRLDRKTDVLPWSKVHNTDREIAEQFCALAPGTYAIYSSSHRINWIYLGNQKGYFYNPSLGSVRVQTIEDLIQCLQEFVKTHTPTANMPTLLVDRIVPFRAEDRIGPVSV